MLPGGTTMFQEIGQTLLGARGFEVFLCCALGSHVVNSRTPNLVFQFVPPDACLVLLTNMLPDTVSSAALVSPMYARVLDSGVSRIKAQVVVSQLVSFAQISTRCLVTDFLRLP